MNFFNNTQCFDDVFTPGIFQLLVLICAIALAMAFVKRIGGRF